MGQILARCLPRDARVAIVDAIPDRSTLHEMADRVVAFERALAVEKAKKQEDRETKRALKTIGKLRKATANRRAAELV